MTQPARSLIIATALSLGLAATAAAQISNTAARRDRDSGNVASLERMAQQSLAQATKTKSGADYVETAQLYYWAVEAAEGRQNKTAGQRDAKAGMDAAQQAVKLSPNSVAAHALLGSLMGQMINYTPNGGMIYGQRAGMELAKALQLDPNNVQALTFQGIDLLYTPPMFGGGPAPAIKDLQKAAALDPKADSPHLWLAQAYAQQKQWPAAKREIQTALRLDPHRGFSHYVAQQITKQSPKP